MRTYWTDESLLSELTEFCRGMEAFPSTDELLHKGRGDISCQINKRGGMRTWAKKLRLPMKSSCSDTGWRGEAEAQRRFKKMGFPAERQKHKAAFDLLVDGILKVDVKAARKATYHHRRLGENVSGWFYRLGKICQADLIALIQLDTKDVYLIPWFLCPHGNITITKNGKYVAFKNNFKLMSDMIALRAYEAKQLRSLLSK